MSIRFDGFDEFRLHLDELGNAIKVLDWHIASPRLVRGQPESLAAAIAEVEAEIDRRLAPYQSNTDVQRVGSELKRKYTEGLRHRYYQLEQ